MEEALVEVVESLRRETFPIEANRQVEKLGLLQDLQDPVDLVSLTHQGPARVWSQSPCRFTS